MIGQLQADHVAGDQAGQVHHADAGQRRLGGGVELDVLDHAASLFGQREGVYRAAPMPPPGTHSTSVAALSFSLRESTNRWSDSRLR